MDEVAVPGAGERGVACQPAGPAGRPQAPVTALPRSKDQKAPLPLSDLCVAALKLRRQEQDTDREHAGDSWVETGLVFTTRHGTPNELRTFTEFDRRISRAKVRRITMHGTRKSYGSPLAALSVHPRVAMHILWHSKFWLDRRG